MFQRRKDYRLFYWRAEGYLEKHAPSIIIEQSEQDVEKNTNMFV